jgi:hypothetical protein|tara:strand:- start:372 stop:650 length:279 start_codon:yes stop_codon:yes gene_type:complete
VARYYKEIRLKSIEINKKMLTINMSKMKLVDELADAQVAYILETLQDSIGWAIDGTDFDNLNNDEMNHVTHLITCATIEKLHTQLDDSTYLV